MEQAAETLVIINSALLAVFLVIGLVVLAQVLVLMRRVRRLLRHIERAATSVDSISHFMKQIFAEVSVGQFIRSFVSNHKSDKPKEPTA